MLDIRQPWLPMVRQMLDDLFDWDGRMLTTLKALLLHPGKLTREFADGRRKTYTSPLRMYLVVSLLFFFALPLIMPDKPFQGPAPTDAAAVENYSRAMFLLLPVFALLVKLFYREHYYLLHLIFSMHVFTAMFLVFTLMLWMENLADEYLFWIVAQVTVFAYMVWYGLTALKVAYGQSWLWSTLKFAGLVTLFLPILSISLEMASGL